MIVTAIPAFDDNYIWAIQPDMGENAIIVDPGDDKPVRAWLHAHDIGIASIFITHHHWDHTNGLKPLLKDYPVPVYGPRQGQIEGVSIPLGHGERFSPEGLTQEFQILETPGHTLDHICFYTTGYLFCGDTLFSGGCGRMFEGTPEQFFESLQCLAELPENTNVYCAHEYTAANLKFALAAEPNNSELQNYANEVARLRAKNLPTIPSTLAREKAINPFIRATSSAEFAKLRSWKDNF